jgi:hypothetical protein
MRGASLPNGTGAECLGVGSVVWARNGTWPAPDEQCPAPRVLLVLYGHLRTFVYTRRTLARMADLASRHCAFTIAVTEESICDVSATPAAGRDALRTCAHRRAHRRAHAHTDAHTHTCRIPAQEHTRALMLTH